MVRFFFNKEVNLINGFLIKDVRYLIISVDFII